MQFQVPQFIEVEDRILGLITMRQFIYVVVAGFTDIFLFMILQTWLWGIITVILILAVTVSAFLTYNGKPILVLLTQMVRYYSSPHLYLWTMPHAAKETSTTRRRGKAARHETLNEQSIKKPRERKPERALKALHLRLLRTKITQNKENLI